MQCNKSHLDQFCRRYTFSWSKTGCSTTKYDGQPGVPGLLAVSGPEADHSERLYLYIAVEEVQAVRQHPAEPDSLARHEAPMFD